jgi:hypothetical protein
MEIIVKKRSDDRPSRQKKQIVLEVAPYWSGYPKIEKDDPLRTENAPAEWSFRCRAAEPVGHATFLRAARRIGRSFCTVFHAFRGGALDVSQGKYRSEQGAGNWRYQ